MNYEKKNNKLIFIFGFCFAAATFGGGFLLGYKIATTGVDGSGAEDTRRVELIEDSVKRIGSGIGGVEKRLSDVGCKIEDGRREITESRTVVGNIEGRIDRIEARNRNAKSSIDGIEDACKRIEQTISEIKNAK